MLAISSAPSATIARLPDSSAHIGTRAATLARRERDEEDEHRDRQEAQPGAERRVAEDVLQVDRQEREQREHAGADAERRRPGRRGTPAAEQRHVEHRPLLAHLDHDERGEQQRRRRRASRRSARSTSPRRCRAAAPGRSGSSAAENESRPATSVRVAPGSRDSRTFRIATANANTPTGTLTKKTQRQLSESVRMPPSSGPDATARPIVAPQIAIALPRAGALVLRADQRERRREERGAADALARRARCRASRTFHAAPHRNEATREDRRRRPRRRACARSGPRARRP